MKIEDFKIYQFHFGTNCIALCMCFLVSKLGLKFETPPSWAQIWACDWARSQVELVCEMHWVWVHRLSKIFPKFETKSQLLSLTQGLSLFMKPAPVFSLENISTFSDQFHNCLPNRISLLLVISFTIVYQIDEFQDFGKKFCSSKSPPANRK